ncbi:uncharacterized protein LOC107801405 [Nicotiana tabacum]|uniref:Uncharacterized protein LOC107801405 n=2 Tax=Nicotiana TaxID=4085 RepID=A0A1S4AU56_TOBAC|nr:PREDICTED: uncharacterized protein LOC104227513 [Nicotiana sylvestris]XP_016480219.1 PREDICTED: uncharacterized protein LOC107801405 [Nicotiana tabacum]
MKPSVARNVYLYSRSLLMPNPCPATTSFWSNYRLFSSKSPNQPLAGSNSGHTRDSNDNSLHDEDDISNKALKRQIDKFFEGDEEAFPSIFEAILKRKLAGKSEESDEELMNDLQAQPRQHDAADKGSNSD